MKRQQRSAERDGSRHGGQKVKIRSDRWLALISLCLLVACDEEYVAKSYEEIHAEAVKLPLPKRYDFYLEVFENSNLPPNDDVKYDIVALGDPAWRYTIERAVRDVFELDRALDVIDAFGRYCTAADRSSLQAAVKRLLNDGTVERAERLSRVDEVCGLTSPRYGPEKRQTMADIYARKR
jgi:hypothetical protein